MEFRFRFFCASTTLAVMIFVVEPVERRMSPPFVYSVLPFALFITKPPLATTGGTGAAACAGAA